ncbi:hypothetical protein StoSoilB20_43450 [Arthrobacter sp. StoSoilB20]|nr:hypothetical protein StoSoilB20_43450 [Arthrobacter sp. StoSoilB20]
MPETSIWATFQSSHGKVLTLDGGSRHRPTASAVGGNNGVPDLGRRATGPDRCRREQQGRTSVKERNGQSG